MRKSPVIEPAAVLLLRCATVDETHFLKKEQDVKKNVNDAAAQYFEKFLWDIVMSVRRVHVASHIAFGVHV